MPTPVTEAHADTLRHVRKAAPALTRDAITRLEQIDWYVALSADVRSWIGVVVAAGVDAFVEWLVNPAAQVAAPRTPFIAVPAAAARAVTLEQTVELIRSSFEAGEAMVAELAAQGDEDWLRASVERYGREIAFAAAVVYARAAEQRGAWDARIQAQLVDALIAGRNEDEIGTWASALGWPATRPVRALAGYPSVESDELIDEIPRAARRSGLHALAGVHGNTILVLVSATGTRDPLTKAKDLLPSMRDIVIGPRASNLLAAGDSVRAALAGLNALPGYPGAQTPIYADDLLPERALAGDDLARSALIEACYKPLCNLGSGLLETADAVISEGGSLEKAARAIPVHVNTLRYRLNRIEELTGYSLRHPRDRFALQVAMIVGRVSRFDEVL